MIETKEKKIVKSPTYHYTTLPSTLANFCFISNLENQYDRPFETFEDPRLHNIQCSEIVLKTDYFYNFPNKIDTLNKLLHVEEEKFLLVYMNKKFDASYVPKRTAQFLKVEKI